MQKIKIHFYKQSMKERLEDVQSVTWTDRAAPQLGEKVIHEGKLYKVFERIFQQDLIEVLAYYVRDLPTEKEKKK